MAMGQPCFGRFYSKDFIQSYLRPELSDFPQILQAALERFSLMQTVPDLTAFIYIPVRSSGKPVLFFSLLRLPLEQYGTSLFLLNY